MFMSPFYKRNQLSRFTYKRFHLCAKKDEIFGKGASKNVAMTLTIQSSYKTSKTLNYLWKKKWHSMTQQTRGDQQYPTISALTMKALMNVWVKQQIHHFYCDLFHL